MNGTQTPDATYFYDGEGRRVKKIDDQTTTVFVYDGGGQLAQEYSTKLSTTPQTSYLTSDHLGSPRITTNQLGSVTARKDYSAFGEETFTPQRTSGLGYDPNNDRQQPEEARQGYTGYQKDSESGLEFAQARYYNTLHGRFTSVDPLTASASIRNPQTFNRYSYALNSPYKFTDPLGLLPESATCNFQCRVMNAIEKGAALSKDDIALAQFHIANGTALGYMFQNAAGNAIQRRQSQQQAENESSSQAKIGVKVNVNRTTYDVEGKDVDEAINNAKIKCGKSTASACTRATYRLQTNHSPMEKGKPVYTTGGNLTVSITVRLPKWKGYDTASKEEQETWDKAMGHLPSHEEEHVEIFRNGAREIADAIPASAPTDAKLGALERRNLARMDAIIQARSDRLDDITDTGRKPK